MTPGLPDCLFNAALGPLHTQATCCALRRMRGHQEARRVRCTVGEYCMGEAQGVRLHSTGEGLEMRQGGCYSPSRVRRTYYDGKIQDRTPRRPWHIQPMAAWRIQALIALPIQGLDDHIRGSQRPRLSRDHSGPRPRPRRTCVGATRALAVQGSRGPHREGRGAEAQATSGEQCRLRRRCEGKNAERDADCVDFLCFSTHYANQREDVRRAGVLGASQAGSGKV